MAGVKRRLDAAHSSAAVSTNSTSAVHNRETAGNDSPNTRVTRNLRSSRDARVGQNDNAKTAPASSGTSNPNSNATNNIANKHGNNRPSRIITLKYGPGKPSYSKETIRATNATSSAAAPTSSAPTSTRETRNSRARAAASATPAVPAAQPNSSRLEATSSTAVAPETPRTKRVKRGSVAEETPRSTRQSTRLKGHVNETPTENGIADVASKQLEASPLAPVASNTRTRNRSRYVPDIAANVSTRSRPPTSAVNSPPPEDATSEADEAPQPEDVDSQTAEPTPPAEELPKGTEFADQQDQSDEYPAPEVEDEPKPMSTRSSPLLSRKRKSLETNDRGVILSTSSSPTKKPKLEDAALDRASEPALQNGDERKLEDAFSKLDDAATSRADEGSRQITEEADDSTTPDNVAESIATKATRGGRTRGRGRGAARNRTSARFGVTRRGRGGTRAARSTRAGRQNDRSSDIEFERSPSPSAATQKLRDRQRELDKAFRKVAAAQRLALAVLATQSEKRIARDKNAHKAVPEYDHITSVLKAQLRERQDTLRREYDLKVTQENRIFQANKEAIEERCMASARYIQEEHLLASHGEYMTFIEGRRAAEDDEHTETDGSETENERGRRAPVMREVYRGFTSSFVRDPAGANSYERAAFGWDDFVQRAKLGDDINPQMKEIRDAGPFAGLSGGDIINMLLEATGVVEVRDGAPVKEHQPPSLADVRPTALAALADLAAAEPPRPPLAQHTPRLAAHRAILPQPPQPPQQPPLHHAHPEPRPFVLPPPTPRGQPRRLLPAGGQQIPPINESLGLPDPFSSRGGPPQLPPPPGSNFQRPPLPGYLAGHHHPGIYYQPPPRPPY
ncbi:uncharacterized protein BDV17DRAFT_162230 [Aspergillus undulatus]|uniref:uncharacterized protein n=1 Tax=Aspergillus undulatus TaxID=1810928 RepID=UPI003CCE09C4